MSAAAELVPPGSRVADIGTGHGLLPRLLLTSGRASYCIASERTADRLARIRPLPEADPCAACLELRAGDGHTVLDPVDRIGVAVMLGMGTRTILRLLDQPASRELAIRRWVLQPQTEWGVLREGLVARRLAIREERLVADRGRIYLLLAVEPAPEVRVPHHPRLEPQDLLEAGWELLAREDPLLLPLWQAEAARRREIARSATGSARGAAERDLARALRILDAVGRRGSAEARDGV